ncbi:g1744 [Coccomyxa viridis]|uniref:G1744 protein n=1 Tax=Coccomyxa viridis TaxID=1274662 RepID=A0ABP1FLM9_9CHLO
MVTQRPLLFQPQLLDSPSKESSSDARPSHSTGSPQAKKSKIPSPSQLKACRQPSFPSPKTNAEHEESADSASSTLSTPEVSSVPKPELTDEECDFHHAAVAESALPSSATTNQVFEGSAASSVVVVVLSGDPEASAMNSFTMEGSASDLKGLISSPAFLKAVKMHAGGKPASREQSSKAGLRRYAAVAATVLSCALIGISLLQQQWPACWDSLTPV